VLQQHKQNGHMINTAKQISKTKSVYGVESSKTVFLGGTLYQTDVL